MRYRNRNRFYTAYGGRFDNRNEGPDFGPGPQDFFDYDRYQPFTSEYRRGDIYGMAPPEISGEYDTYEQYDRIDYPQSRNISNYRGYFGIEDPLDRELRSSYNRFPTGREEGYGGDYGAGGFRYQDRDDFPRAEFERGRDEERTIRGGSVNENRMPRGLPRRGRFSRPENFRRSENFPRAEKWERESQFDEKGRGVGHYRYDNPRDQQKFWE